MTADIDVVISYCNYPAYVADAVRSALDQDGVNTRVIVVDDASDDPLPALGDDPRIEVIRHPSRRGPGASHNTGLRACTADYVSFLDADDLYPSDRSQLLLDLMVRTPADLTYGAQQFFNDGDVPLLRLTPEQRRSVPSGPPGLIPGTVLVRTQAARRFGDMLQDRMVGAFLDWVVRARTGPNPPREQSIQAATLLRRSHATNITRVFAHESSGLFEAIAKNRGTVRREQE